MFKRFLHKSVLICSTVPAFKIEESEIEAYKAARGFFIEDDWERVKTIFQLDDYGNIHPELDYCILMAQYGLFAGAFVGGTIQSIHDTHEFIRTNDANVYWTRNEALRKLSRISVLSFFKGGWKYGPKFSIFFAGFSLISSCCELYRNKPGVIENTIGGAGIGALLRSTKGIKGAISGGVIGGILGTIYGFLSEAVYKLSNKDKIELKYAAIAFSKYKKELKKLRTTEGQQSLEDVERFEKRFSEKNEDKTDRLKHLDMEETAPEPPPVTSQEKKN